MASDTILKWEPVARKKYEDMIARIPLFHREIAVQVVEKKALLNAQERAAPMIEECDIVRAFLSEIPKALYSMMIRLMDNVGFDHKAYETD